MLSMGEGRVLREISYVASRGASKFGGMRLVRNMFSHGPAALPATHCPHVPLTGPLRPLEAQGCSVPGLGGERVQQELQRVSTGRR
jgi:hypothetical protein